VLGALCVACAAEPSADRVIAAAIEQSVHEPVTLRDVITPSEGIVCGHAVTRSGRVLSFVKRPSRMQLFQDQPFVANTALRQAGCAALARETPMQWDPEATRRAMHDEGAVTVYLDPAPPR
jgi:hypothetical protein